MDSLSIIKNLDKDSPKLNGLTKESKSFIGPFLISGSLSKIKDKSPPSFTTWAFKTGYKSNSL